MHDEHDLALSGEAFRQENQGLSKRCNTLVKGALGPRERVYLYHAVKNLYTGQGEIVELGAFLGASTQALCAGLVDNLKPAARTKRLHSFDLFFYDGSWGQREITKQYGLVEGQSFIDVFRENTSAFSDRLAVHQVDLLTVDTFPPEVEILFVDIAKTEQLLLHLAEVFFPSMVVGGLCLNQDFFMEGLSYIKSFTQYFREYFELYDPQCDATLAMRLVKPWDVPEDELRRYASLSFDAKKQLHEDLNRQFGDERRHVLQRSLENMSQPFVLEKML